MAKSICKDKNDCLCDSCVFRYPECGGQDVEIDFGTGIGFDNIVECDGYEPDGELSETIEVIND